MVRLFLTILISVLIFTALKAQKQHHFTIKTDAVAALKQTPNLALEWQWNHKNALEIMVGWRDFPDQNIFVGTKSVDFAIQEFSLKANGEPEYSPIAGPEYLGSGRPFESFDAYHSLSTMQVAIGYRFFYNFTKGPLQVMLEPEVIGLKHDYLLSSQNTTASGVTVSYLDIVNPIHGKMSRTINQYTQTWSMEPRHFRTVGLAYNIGIRYVLKRRFSIELKVARGVMLGNKPEVEDVTKELAYQQFWGRTQLQFGYRFW